MANILKFSDAVSLALHTVVLLAANGKRSMSTREIAAALYASEAHLSKVLQRLTRVGLVKSIRGPKGGFELTGDPDSTSLLSVYEAIEGQLEGTDCLLGKRLCDGKSCILGELLKSTNRQVREYLSQTVLSDVTSVYGGVASDA